MRIPLPQVLAGMLAARQASVLPSDVCSPECPSCKDEIVNFVSATACTANSSFIQNCGHCQTCIMTWAIENGGLDSQSGLEQEMVNVLNWCDNTTVAGEIQALQSQASIMSVLGAELATTTNSALASMTGSFTMAITSPPSTTHTSEPWETMTGDGTAWKSILSTASWAPAYYSLSAASASASASAAAERTRSGTPNPSQSGIPTPLSPTWIAGPVIGSVMGICTVVAAIFFTRQRQRRQEQRELEHMVETGIKKEFHDNDLDNESVLPSPRPPEKAQLHSESRRTMATEADNTEVYELPASEPVASELSTPIGPGMRDEDWPLTPLPLSPVALLFAQSEMRDQRLGDRSPRHNTFYHP